jgi:hypothetical protein
MFNVGGRRSNKYALGGQPQPYPKNPRDDSHDKLDRMFQTAALGGLIDDDWWDNIKDTLSDVGAKGLGLIDKVKKEFEDRGAAVLTGTNYVGPKNRIDEAFQKSNPPKNDVDQAGLTHDLTYADIAKRRDAGEITKEQANEEIRKSDDVFLKTVQANYKEDPFAALLGYAGIWSKTVAEDVLGLDRNAFVTLKRGGQVKSFRR